MTLFVNQPNNESSPQVNSRSSHIQPVYLQFFTRRFGSDLVQQWLLDWETVFRTNLCSLRMHTSYWTSWTSWQVIRGLACLLSFVVCLSVGRRFAGRRSMWIGPRGWWTLRQRAAKLKQLLIINAPSVDPTTTIVHAHLIYLSKITSILLYARSDWLDYHARWEYIKRWRVHHFPGFCFSPRIILFINEIYNLGEHSSSVGKLLGCALWPTLLVFFRLPACLDDSILHGNALLLKYQPMKNPGGAYPELKRNLPQFPVAGVIISPAHVFPRWHRRHGGKTLFCHAVASILSQRLLHKMTNSKSVLIARLHASKTSKLSRETQYLASILSDTFVKCIFRNISCALEVKFHLDFHWVIYGHGNELLTNGRDVKDVFPRCRHSLGGWQNETLLAWLCFPIVDSRFATRARFVADTKNVSKKSSEIFLVSARHATAFWRGRATLLDTKLPPQCVLVRPAGP